MILLECHESPADASTLYTGPTLVYNIQSCRIRWRIPCRNGREWRSIPSVVRIGVHCPFVGGLWGSNGTSLGSRLRAMQCRGLTWCFSRIEAVSEFIFAKIEQSRVEQSTDGSTSDRALNGAGSRGLRSPNSSVGCRRSKKVSVRLFMF